MSLCTRCGADFSCGQQGPGASEPCWCMALPAALPVPVPAAGSAAAGCWCPACLQAHIDGLAVPAPAVTPSK